MSIKKLIPVGEVITQLIDETSPEYMNMVPMLVRWAKQCDLRIGSYYSYEKQYYVRKVKNGYVELPLSTVHVLGLVMGNHLNRVPGIFNNNFIITESSEHIIDGINQILLWNDMSRNFMQTRFNWEIQDNSIVFPGGVFDEHEVTIASLNYKEDANGWPMVNENHLQAITTWLKLKLAKKEQWRSMMVKTLVPSERIFIKDLENEYRFEVRQATANDGDWNELETQAMSEMMGHPFSGNGSFNLY